MQHEVHHDIEKNLVFTRLKKSARRDSIFPPVQKANKIKEERTLSTAYLQTVYKLKFERKAVKGSAKQIHLVPLLLFVVVEIYPLLKRARLEQYPLI